MEDYKKYSLEQLENWIHDALSAGEASAEEIYNTIKKVVQEQYYHHKHHASQANELLALLNGNGIGHTKEYDAVMRERNYYVGSDVDSILKCDKDGQSPECKGAWNDFWEENYCPEEYALRETEYYNSEKPKTYKDMVSDGWSMTADGFWIKENTKKDKVNKWVLPVQVDDAAGDAEPIYYINLPDDLLEAANLREGDQVYWIDRNDGSFEIRKVTKPLEMYEC